MASFHLNEMTCSIWHDVVLVIIIYKKRTKRRCFDGIVYHLLPLDWFYSQGMRVFPPSLTACFKTLSLSLSFLMSPHHNTTYVPFMAYHYARTGAEKHVFWAALEWLQSGRPYTLPFGVLWTGIRWSKLPFVSINTPFH